MIIHKLTIQNFFGFKNTQLVLPDTGLVVVQGKNGKGKTARTITAPSWISWGTTERGTPPYPHDTKPNVVGTIDVTTNAGRKLSITRAWKGTKKEVSFSVDGGEPTEYSTTSKADTALAELTGDYMTWRRTHVFSGADAAMFSHADDATRKRLLETMLNLDIFDGPLAAARQQLKEAIHAQTTTGNQIDKFVMQRNQIVAQAKQLKELVGEPGDTEHITQSLAVLKERKASIQAAERTSAQRVGAAQAKMQQAQGDLMRVGDGTCRTCGQALPHKDHGKHKAEAEEAVRAAQAAFAAVQAEVGQEIQQARNEVAKLDQQMQQLAVDLANAKRAEQAVAKLDEYRAQAKELKDKVIALEMEAGEVDWEVQVLTHAANVLSTKGVRAMLLGRALQSLAELANAYLQTLKPGISIDLLPTSETKGGKTTDAISLVINGMGGGWGYKASSGGERKRVDIALLLALSALAGNKGTLIFDEAMDAIDDDGVSAVSSLLMTVSQTRPVVIITHNEALADSLTGAQRIQLS